MQRPQPGLVTGFTGAAAPSPRMKLVFPGGEHPQVLLGQGVNRIGSDPEANIVLDRPGVLPRHCELHVSSHGVMLQVPPGTDVLVNGRHVDGVISLRLGDMVSLDRVQARLASIDTAGLRPEVHAAGAANEDMGATVVRPVLPRYVLRGVSGDGFGRSYPVVGLTTVGRSDECNLHLDSPGLSRQHARLTPMDKGLWIEDLDSTNGCKVNGKRIHRALAAPGDEISFDALRFRLVSPGHADAVHVHAVPGARSPRLRTGWMVAAIAGAGIAIAILVYALR